MAVSFQVGSSNLVGAAAVTAGTTQTQAGATELTGLYNTVTTGSSNDGVRLPKGAPGQVLFFLLGATATKLYPPVGGAINGGTVDASVTPTASKVTMVVYTSDLNAYTGTFA